MNIFKKLFQITKPLPSSSSAKPSTFVTAKEKQAFLVKNYLKPALKNQGYLTNGQTWWKERKDFFIIINLQNYSWNTKHDVNFCFNIGIGLKSLKKDISKKPSGFDLTVNLREGGYLDEIQKTTWHRNTTGYLIDQTTDIGKFTHEIKKDFEAEILPKLEKLNTMEDCIKFFERIPFWGDRLKELTAKNS